MTFFKKLLFSGAAIAGTALGSVAMSAGPASAYVVCNREGDCWHTERRYHAPGITFEYHPDDWYFHRHWDADHDHHWRNEYHEGRGYWHNGVWVTF
jgi:hypothetical protein